MWVYLEHCRVILLLLITFSISAANPDNIQIEEPPWVGHPLVLCNPYPLEDTVFYPDTRGRKYLYEEPQYGYVIAISGDYIYFSEKLKYNNASGILYSIDRNCAVGLALENQYFYNRYTGKFNFYASKFIKTMVALKETTE